MITGDTHYFAIGRDGIARPCAEMDTNGPFNPLLSENKIAIFTARNSDHHHNEW